MRYEVLMGPYALSDLAAELTELVRRKVIHISKKIGERHVCSIAFGAECGNLAGFRRVKSQGPGLDISVLRSAAK